MTVEEFLSNFCSSIELTEKQRDKVASRHKKLRKKLREKLELADDFLTGSYAKHTMIRPLDEEDKFDVDFFVTFSGDDHDESELEDLKNEVLNGLEDIEKDDNLIESVRPQDCSIGIIYSDEFQIDVVPAIEIEKDEIYKIFERQSGEPVMSNPKLHANLLTKANDASESGGRKRLVPMIKLLKYWKRMHCDYVKSFHIELLCLRLIGEEKIDSFSQGLSRFFDLAPDYVRDHDLIDPANERNIINEYLNSDEDKLDAFITQLENAQGRVDNALELERNGDEQGSLKEWRKLFEIKDKSDDRSIEIPSIIPAKPWAE